MNYEQSLKELSGFINYEKRLTHKSDYDIENFKAFLASINSPQNHGITVTVAGTKGKGSTTCYITNALVNLGYNVGSFYSPHIRDIRERINFNNEWIDKETFSETFSYIACHLGRREKSYKTFFEILVSMAFLYFIKMKTDFNILEVGLGGRLDSTNAAPNKYAVITHIGLDHTDVLGNTAEKIAFEKAGIIKPGGTVITGFQTDSVKDIIIKRADELAAQTIIAENVISDIISDTENGIVSFTHQGNKYRFKSDMAGLHQTQNMILAFLLLKELEIDHIIPGNFNENLFLGKSLSGRFELREWNNHKFILDGAHNRDAMKMLVKNFKEYYGDSSVDIIFTCMRNKDYSGMIKEIKKLNVNKIYIDHLNTKRELKINDIKEELINQGFDNIFTENIEKLVENTTSEHIIITGSFYLVGKWELFLDKII